jgi:ribosomal protein S15P/S13E
MLNFQKKTLLQKHLRKQHTGQESDIFIKYLIQNQAKALVTPSKQMRWHPLVIKYCLANYRSQSSYDQLSKSGFLKLPSGRLLQYYRQFNKQESSWNYENINQMNQNFEHHSYSIQSKLGILIFDEMKIKEGLIWSQHNNQLLGFTDVECMQDRSDEEFLASNVLQIFF